MTSNSFANCVWAVAIITVSGCAERTATTKAASPKMLFDDLTASVTSVKADFSREEPLASEDRFAGIGEVRARLTDLRAVTSDREDLQPTFKSIDETLDELDKVLNGTGQVTQVLQGLGKLEEQMAVLGARI